MIYQVKETRILYKNNIGWSLQVPIDFRGKLTGWRSTKKCVEGQWVTPREEKVRKIIEL